MDDDDQVSNFDDKTYLRTMVFELKRIIDVLKPLRIMTMLLKFNLKL